MPVGVSWNNSRGSGWYYIAFNKVYLFHIVCEADTRGANHLNSIRN